MNARYIGVEENQVAFNALTVRKRQGIVADLKVKGDIPMKGSALVALCEVKTLNAGQRYAVGNTNDKRGAAVKKRQNRNTCGICTKSKKH